MNTPYVALVSPSAKVRLIASDMFIDSGSIWAPRYLITLLMPTFEYLDNQVSGVNRGHYFFKNSSARWKGLFQVMDLVMFGSPEAHRKALDTIPHCWSGALWEFNWYDYWWMEWIHSIRELYLLLYLVNEINVGTRLLWCLLSTSAFLRSHSSPDSNVCDSYIVCVYWPRARWCNVSHRYPHRRSVLNRLTFFVIVSARHR
jgi:hypothetical protein